MPCHRRCQFPTEQPGVNVGAVRLNLKRCNKAENCALYQRCTVKAISRPVASKFDALGVVGSTASFSGGAAGAVALLLLRQFSAPHNVMNPGANPVNVSI